MKTQMWLVIVVALAVASACGGKAKPADEPGPGADPDAEADEAHDPKEEHGELPAAVHEFHEALAPLWHATEGLQRTEDTCAAVRTLGEKASVIANSPTPPQAATDEPGWKGDADGLVVSVDALAAECRVNGRPRFQEKFAGIHDAFHKLTDRLGGKH